MENNYLTEKEVRYDEKGEFFPKSDIFNITLSSLS